MQRQYEMELARVKTKYEDAITQVDGMSRNLQNLFKEKVRSIKEKSAMFFAKMEMKSKQLNEEVLHISQMNRHFQENIAGPTQKFDAQLFTLKSIVDTGETERESEFALMQEVMKKLIHALEDKATTEVFSAQAREELSDSNYLITPDIANKTFNGRKGSHPPPMNRFMNESGLKHQQHTMI